MPTAKRLLKDWKIKRMLKRKEDKLGMLDEDLQTTLESYSLGADGQ